MYILLTSFLVLSNFTDFISASNFGAIHSQSSSEKFSIYKHHWRKAELQLSFSFLCPMTHNNWHTGVKPVPVSFTHSYAHTHIRITWMTKVIFPQHDWKNTGEQCLCCPSTLEVARWCSWASGRRNGQSCWSGNSSPPQTLAAGTQRPLTGAGRAGEAERHRGRAAEIPSDPAAPRNQKGRKRIQRRCDTCARAHTFMMQTGY